MSSIIASSDPVPCDARDRARVVVELGEPERLREPARRVDGEHDDASTAVGRAQRQRRRGGGLADAARAAADDDADRAVVEQRVDVESARCAVRCRLGGVMPSPGSRSVLGEVVERADVDPVGQDTAARTSGARAPAIVSRLARLERRRAPRGRPPRRRVRPRRSCEEHGPVRTGEPSARGEDSDASRDRPRSRRDRACALRALVCAVADSSGRRTWLTTTPPTGRPAARSSRTPSTVSCTGISSSSVTRCTAVEPGRDDLHHRVGLRADRAGPGEPGHLGVDVEEPGDAPGGRRVHDDGVVDRARRPCLRRTASFALPVSSTSRTPGAMVVAKSIAPILLQRRPGAAQVVEHLEVLDERLLGIDGEREDLAAAGGDGHAPLGVRQRRDVEDLGEALAALDLDDEHLAPARRQGQRERGGHGGLAGPALAGHDVQPHAVPVGVRRLSVSRARVRAYGRNVAGRAGSVPEEARPASPTGRQRRPAPCRPRVGP